MLSTLEAAVAALSKMIVEVVRSSNSSRHFDDSSGDKQRHKHKDKDKYRLPLEEVVIMEDNTVNLVDMEGYLEVKIVADNSHPIFSHIHHRHNYDYHHPHLQQSKVKSAKMLTPNKKYWFVLSQSCLDFYENK